jgi:hypothetical protein
MSVIMPVTVAVAAAVDKREVFLVRAAVRWELVEAGEMELDEAIVGLVPAFEELIGPRACVRDVVDRWERDFPPRNRGRR